ncbi:MAG TPA: hypothetical protein ENI27_01010 [bacterium]|nr:hypothetical protein [bacterium]
MEPIREGIMDRVYRRISAFHKEGLTPVWIEFGMSAYEDLCKAVNALVAWNESAVTPKMIFGYEVKNNGELHPDAIEPVLPPLGSPH